MNLDQRVQVLEQEVQLLKAQIQATLLEIHEHLLNNTYPMLSTPEPGKPSTPEFSGAPSANSAKRISIAEVAPDQEFEPEALVQETPSVHSGVFREEVTQPSRLDWDGWNDTPQQSTELNARDWIELENWVSQKVEKLGIKRTRELIDLYAQQARFTLQERELLMQFVHIYGGEPADKSRTGTHHPILNDPPVSVPPTIAPQTRAVVEEIRQQLRHRPENSLTAQNGSSHPFTQRQELVLRLMAGILSAGEDSSNGSNHRHHK